jgi:hypothetical protein
MGQSTARSDISAMTNASPCLVTTSAAHGYSTGNFVRITDLNGGMPVPRGEDQINRNRYRIVVTDTDKFTLEDPITFEDIDSSTYAAYVTGGYVNLIQTDFEYTA